MRAEKYAAKLGPLCFVGRKGRLEKRQISGEEFA